MAEGKTPVTATLTINNKTDPAAQKTAYATPQVVDGHLVADDRQTNPGVQV